MVGESETVMTQILLVLLLTMPAICQDTPKMIMTFFLQGKLGPFDSYGVIICNPTDSTANFNAGVVKNAAKSEGINAATFSKINAELGVQEQMSPIRIMALVAEIVGYGMSVAVATDSLWPEHSSLQKTLPMLVSAGLRFATTITADYTVKVAETPDRLPVFITIEPGPTGCKEFTMLAVP